MRGVNMEANNIRHFICKFVNRTRIIFKLFLMISCVLLSACYIENKKISSVGKSNSAFFCGFYRYIYF